MNDIEQNIKVLFFLFYEIQTFKEENTSRHMKTFYYPDLEAVVHSH